MSLAGKFFTGLLVTRHSLSDLFLWNRKSPGAGRLRSLICISLGWICSSTDISLHCLRCLGQRRPLAFSCFVCEFVPVALCGFLSIRLPVGLFASDALARHVSLHFLALFASLCLWLYVDFFFICLLVGLFASDALARDVPLHFLALFASLCLWLYLDFFSFVS